MRMPVVGQIVPLLVEMVRHPDAVLPLAQPATFALRPDRQRAEEVVALAQILVPDGQQNGLFVEFVRARLERELFVVDRIKSAPFDAGLAFLVAMCVRL